METNVNGEEYFDIVIYFNPGKGDPARVFKTMSGLIESFQIMDRHLVSMIDVSLKADLVLENVEKGSIKATIRNIVKGIPDEALKNGEGKKIVGYFMHGAKYKILDWCNDRDEISGWEELKLLRDELEQLKEEVKIYGFSRTTTIPVEYLLNDILRIQESLQNLLNEDKAVYGYDTKSIRLKQDLKIPSKVILDILALDTFKETNKKILKVVKTDYERQSMWKFLLDGKVIEAKIAIPEWVEQFQSRRVIVEPGDLIKVLLYEAISYGFEGDIVHSYYEVEKVFNVIKPYSQPKINF